MAVRRPRAPPQQRDERHDAASAVVIGAHHQRDLRQRDDDLTDQKINDTRPYTLSVLIGTGSGSLGLKAVWMVIGLVPMSAEHDTQCATEIAM
jgi:hypothetical protein